MAKVLTDGLNEKEVVLMLQKNGWWVWHCPWW